jgi:hypothetical protein
MYIFCINIMNKSIHTYTYVIYVLQAMQEEAEREREAEDDMMNQDIGKDSVGNWGWSRQATGNDGEDEEEEDKEEKEEVTFSVGWVGGCRYK